MLDDVLDLFCCQTKVDGNQNSSRSRDTEEGRQEAGRVVRDHRHALADGDAKSVETSRLGPRPLGHLAVGERAPRLSGLVGFIHDGDPIGVQKLGSADVINNGERNTHDIKSRQSEPLGSLTRADKARYGSLGRYPCTQHE